MKQDVRNFTGIEIKWEDSLNLTRYTSKTLHIPPVLTANLKQRIGDLS